MRYVVNEYTTDTATHQTTLFAQHFFATDEHDKAMEFIEAYVPMTNIVGVKWAVSDKPFLTARTESLV